MSKSSKGRGRPAVNSSLCSSDLENIHRPPESPPSSRADKGFRSRSQPDIWQSRMSIKEEVFHLLQVSPASAPQSLNRYKVLPSIERKQSEESSERILNKMMPKLDLSYDALTQTCGFKEDGGVDGQLRARPQPPDADKNPAAGSSSGLLLAVRAPCGRRFQQHFNPADTLLAVRASAEVRYGTRYGDVSVETMDVPRRTFTDLNMTLEQCGILNRSLLCISHSDHVEQQTNDLL